MTPARRLINSRLELQEAVAEQLGVATQSVRIATSTGALFQLANKSVVEKLLALLVADRQASVQILVDDAQWLQTQAPRLKQLHKRFSQHLQLRLATSDDPVGEDQFLLIDDQHCLTVRAGRLVAGESWLNNAPRVQPLRASFERRWQAAAHDLAVTPLGL